MENPIEIKVVLLGNTGVGKSCIVSRFVKNTFDSNMPSTLGGMFLSKMICLGPNCELQFNIWDTAGQEKYRSMASMYYKDADIAILVYSIDNRKSFESVNFWINELKAKAPNKIMLYIVSNKSDKIKDEVVKFDEGKRLSIQHNAIFKITSAKCGDGIDDLFTTIGTMYIKANNLIVNSRVNINCNLKLEDTNKKKKKKQTCC